MNKFGANLHVKTNNDLTVMHCAAQSYTGYLSILMLATQYKFDVNV